MNDSKLTEPIGLRRRRRSFLEVDHEVDLSQFVLTTCKSSGEETIQSYSPVSIKSATSSKVSCHSSDNQIGGLQKRRLVDCFSKLDLNDKVNQKEEVGKPRPKIQVINSIRFDGQSESSSMSDISEGHMQDSELGFTGSTKSNTFTNKQNLSIDSLEGYKLEVADQELMAQINQQRRNYFFDTGSSNTFRSRSTEVTSCREIELRNKVINSKKMLLKNFFSSYLKSIFTCNEKLNKSYLEKIKQEYSNLRADQKITFQELKESVEEMEVDEEGKQQIIELLRQQTNMKSLFAACEDSPMDEY